MKFTFTQNWGSNKAGATENVPKQLANMLQEQGVGKIVDTPVKTEVIENIKIKGKIGGDLIPNETPKSNAKPS